MGRNILVIHYSQSGQLTDILKNYCKPFSVDELDWVAIEPETTFPFPWTTPAFFDQMPETVLEKPSPIKPLHFKHDHYDLVIFGYQPWYLSPSIPTMAALKDEEFRKRLQGTSVVTLIGSRNMWLNSQEVVKREIHSAGGKLIGNVPLIDRTSNLISVVTILHWMLTGQKTKKWGIFPKPGVSDEDIAGVEEFGILLQDYLNSNQAHRYQDAIIEKKGVTIPISILFIEKKAKRLFIIWAKLILNQVAKGGKRKSWISIFKYYLIFALFVVSPILLMLYFIFVRPFKGKQIKSEIAYYSSTELK